MRATALSRSAALPLVPVLAHASLTVLRQQHVRISYWLPTLLPVICTLLVVPQTSATMGGKANVYVTKETKGQVGLLALSS